MSLDARRDAYSGGALPFLWTPPPGSRGLVTFGADDGAGDAEPDASSPELPPHRNLQEPVLLRLVFSAEECQRIRSLAEQRPLWSGRSSSPDADYRVCTTSWVARSEDTGWIFDRIARVVRQSNAEYRFELAGFGEPLHYVIYGPGGKFDWHSDLGPDRASNRKLSVSIQLSPESSYAGGLLELSPHGPLDAFREQGSTLVFPAYIPHRVLPVTSGKRHALVAWIHGVPFR